MYQGHLLFFTYEVNIYNNINIKLKPKDII